MFSRQSIWFQMAVILVTAFLIWFLCGERVEASGLVYEPASFTYGGKEYIYYYTDSIYTSDNSISLSQYFYVLLYKGSSTGGMFFCSKNSGNIIYKQTYYSTNLSDGVHFIGLSGVDMSVFDSSMVNYYTGDSNKLLVAFMTYLGDNKFPIPEEVKQPVFVQTSNASSDSYFSLSNVKGYVTDNVFYANWTVPLGVGEDSGVMPLLVDFSVTNLDTNVRTNICYPAISELPDAPRATYFDVKDTSLEIDLSKVEGLPTNYRIDFVRLTPYYYADLISLTGLSLRKGQTSLIYLDYTGKYEGTIQVSPDDTIIEDDANKTIIGMISNFFSGFFNNFLSMLKDAFVPTAEDMNDLLERMQAWFSDRLGFLWYPFDIAFDIVDALAEGERNSQLKVPALVVNLSSVGTYTIWEEMTIDFDQMGIFEYVRFFTSCTLACGVAVLAINKFDEWIGGHVHANGGDFWK